MTLSVLEGHFSIASFFMWDFRIFWHVSRSLCICRGYCHSMSYLVKPPLAKPQCSARSPPVVIPWCQCMAAHCTAVTH